MWLNCKVAKKWHPPPPFFQVYPPFLTKHFVPPQVTPFLEGPFPPFNKEGGRGSKYDTSVICYSFEKIEGANKIDLVAM